MKNEKIKDIGLVLFSNKKHNEQYIEIYNILTNLKKEEENQSNSIINIMKKQKYQAFLQIFNFIMIFLCVIIQIKK